MCFGEASLHATPFSPLLFWVPLLIYNMLLFFGTADEFTMVPQPDLQGASDIISAEEVQRRLEKRAEELRNDPTLTEVGGCL